MKSGELTGKIGYALSNKLRHEGFEVFFDHGEKDQAGSQYVGQIASWFGDKYCFETRLALLDLAIVERDTNQALALIEIEESSSKPKVIIGDVFGTILGEYITFQGNRNFVVNEDTVLLIYIHGEENRLSEKINHLNKHTNDLIGKLTTGNSVLRRILISSFSDEDDLRNQLFQYVSNEVLGRK